MVLVSAALLGDMHETHEFPLFLEVPRGSLCACVECLILLAFAAKRELKPRDMGLHCFGMPDVVVN